MAIRMTASRERETKEFIQFLNPDALFADGFDSCIIGTSVGTVPVVAYDLAKMISLLMKRDGMSFMEASEYISYNVVGSYMGENSPVFISRL